MHKIHQLLTRRFEYCLGSRSIPMGSFVSTDSKSKDLLCGGVNGVFRNPDTKNRDDNGVNLPEESMDVDPPL